MGGGGFCAAFEVKTFTRAFKIFSFRSQNTGNLGLKLYPSTIVEFLEMHFESFIFRNLAMHV